MQNINNEIAVNPNKLNLNQIIKLKVLQNFDINYIKSIKLICGIFEQEAFIVKQNEDVFHIKNNSEYKIDVLCQQNVTQFKFAYIGETNNYHLIVQTKDNRVYVWGRNNYDQVNNGPQSDVIIPNRVKIGSGLGTELATFGYKLSENIRLVSTQLAISCKQFCRYIESSYIQMAACGSAHCMAVTSNRTIVLWGNNTYGQIGNGKISKKERSFEIYIKKVEITEDDAFSCGECTACLSTCACSIGSAVYCFPYSIPSLISCPIVTCFICHRKKEQNVIISEEDNVEIDTIACGAFHNLLLFKNGHLYGWGSNEFGQLGIKNSGPILWPRLIFEEVKSIATNNSHTLVLLKDDTLYAMGDNTFAQLGNNKNVKANTPIKINIKFDEIATVNCITFGKGKDNEFYAAGLYRFERFWESVPVNKKSEAKNVQKQNEMGEPSHDKKDVKEYIKITTKAYIIPEFKKINCKSVNEFTIRCFSTTYDTIEIESEDPNCSNEIVQTGPLVDIDDETLIDEKELMIRQNVPILDLLNNNMTTNNFNVNDFNEFSAFKNCSMNNSNGEINLENLKFCGKETTNRGFFNFFR